jgi:uncharacterized protein YgiM (DUF1202 family)
MVTVGARPERSGVVTRSGPTNFVTPEENSMKIGFLQTARSRANMTCGAVVLALVYNGALGAEISPDNLKIAPGVIKADGYETPPAKGYIVANSTNVFSGHAVYGTDITGQLKVGEKVEILAKVKGWDWMLVGNEGTGIGYVPNSMLAPEDKYVAPMGGRP